MPSTVASDWAGSMLEVWGSVAEDEWGLVDPASYVFPYLFCLPVLHWPARCVPGVLLAGPMLVSYICPSGVGVQLTQCGLVTPCH